ncbi:MAG: prepilin-type N-terminal cleavage/methylation domain-containing protein [Desulfobacter sp.]
MQDKTKIDANAGFTLLELLLALAIFAIGILGLANMQLRSTNGNTHARKVSEASEFGQGEVEQVMGISYAKLANGTTVTVSNGYTITRTVADALDSDGNTIPGLKEIIVTVNDPQGNQRSSLRITKPANM